MEYSRQSNFELLRIIAMILIVLLHCNFYFLGYLTPEQVQISPIDSWWRSLFEHLCVVGVNVFVLISGWFRIKPTVKGFCSLVFQVLFWGGLVFILNYLYTHTIDAKMLFRFACLGSIYWFIWAYILLYAISPILNTYLDHSSQKTQLYVLLVFFGLEFIYDGLAKISFFNQGYNAFSFIGLYLLANYIKNQTTLPKKMNSFIWLGLYILTSSVNAAIYYIALGNPYLELHTLSYASPLVILSSGFLFMTFVQCSFHSKVINWMAPSILSVYLLHLHPSITPYLKTIFGNLYTQTTGYTYILICILFALALCLICILVDQIRIFLWKLILITPFKS